jgi:hypothetical protein
MISCVGRKNRNKIGELKREKYVEVRKGEKDGEEERKGTKKEEEQEMRGINKGRYIDSCR